MRRASSGASSEKTTKIDFSDPLSCAQSPARMISSRWPPQPTRAAGTDLRSVRCFLAIVGTDQREAITWIAERWSVPTIAKKHLTDRRSVPAARVGCGGHLEEIIRAGLWAQLSGSEKSILVVFSELAPLDALRIS